MLTKRYGTHSFEENWENMVKKMDDFLIGKKKMTQKAAAVSVDDAAEQIKALAKDNPELLIQILQSIQGANK